MDRETETTLEVSLVFPAHNESKKIVEAVLESEKFMREITKSFEIIIAEDGSTDGTDVVAADLSEKHAYVKHLHHDERLGRGQALTRAFKASRGETLVYMDVDLSTDLRFLKPLIRSIIEGHDVATGSRRLRGSRAERSPMRQLASTAYNGMVRLFLDSRLQDHQCGFKAFNRRSLFQIIDRVRSEHWFWDTEVLILASRSGYKINEIAVNWKGGEATKVRLFWDTLKMGLAVIRLWWRLNSPFKKEI